MGYPTKVQLIQRKDSRQWYINFPAPIAQAIEENRDANHFSPHVLQSMVMPRGEKWLASLFSPARCGQGRLKGRLRGLPQGLFGRRRCPPRRPG